MVLWEKLQKRFETSESHCYIIRKFNCLRSKLQVGAPVFAGSSAELPLGKNVLLSSFSFYFSTSIPQFSGRVLLILPYPLNFHCARFLPHSLCCWYLHNSHLPVCFCFRWSYIYRCRPQFCLLDCLLVGSRLEFHYNAKHVWFSSNAKVSHLSSHGIRFFFCCVGCLAVVVSCLSAIDFFVVLSISSFLCLEFVATTENSVCTVVICAGDSIVCVCSAGKSHGLVLNKKGMSPRAAQTTTRKNMGVNLDLQRFRKENQRWHLRLVKVRGDPTQTTIVTRTATLVIPRGLLQQQKLLPQVRAQRYAQRASC